MDDYDKFMNLQKYCSENKNKIFDEGKKLGADFAGVYYEGSEIKCEYLNNKDFAKGINDSRGRLIVYCPINQDHSEKTKVVLKDIEKFLSDLNEFDEASKGSKLMFNRTEKEIEELRANGIVKQIPNEKYSSAMNDLEKRAERSRREYRIRDGGRNIIQ